MMEERYQEKAAGIYNISTQMLGLAECLIDAANYLGELEVFNAPNSINMMLSDMDSAFLQFKKSLKSVNQLQEYENLVFTVSGAMDTSDISDIRSHWEYVRITALSAEYSLSRIARLYDKNPIAAQDKVKYELVPFCIVLYERIFELKNLLADKAGEKKAKNQELKNKFREDGQQTGVYKYTLSICVTGYNKLEYTKMCMEHLLKFLPDDISYELVLVNHGSSDGTKEYFESLSPTKQVDVLINGAAFTFDLITEGKYILGVSNDVLVTHNAIKNLLTCMESNEDYGFVVPATSNISNYQSIEIQYNSIEEMFHVAEKNNLSDPYRWEERFRLCNPICLQRASYRKENQELKRLYAEAKGSKVFPDDSWSYYMRRNGYKNILAKDAFCYHFGSVTIKEQLEKRQSYEEDFYEKGRKIFQEELGIDPWGHGLCFDKELCDSLNYHKLRHVDILAINCGYGSTPLKIKESVREVSHNEDTAIYAFTDCIEAAIDAEILSDYFCMACQYSDVYQKIENKQFDFIIQEDNFKNCMITLRDVQILYHSLKNGGVLAINHLSVISREKIAKYFKYIRFSHSWILITKRK